MRKDPDAGVGFDDVDEEEGEGKAKWLLEKASLERVSLEVSDGGGGGGTVLSRFLCPIPVLIGLLPKVACKFAVRL